MSRSRSRSCPGCLSGPGRRSAAGPCAAGPRTAGSYAAASSSAASRAAASCAASISAAASLSRSRRSQRPVDLARGRTIPPSHHRPGAHVILGAALAGRTPAGAFLSGPFLSGPLLPGACVDHDLFLSGIHITGDMLHQNVLQSVRTGAALADPAGKDAFRHCRSDHGFHALHLLIIIHHGHSACQHHHCQHAAGRPQHPHRGAAFSSFHLAILHFLAEIPDHHVPAPALHPPGVLAGHHIILHHLVPLIIDAVALELIKPVLRGSIDGLLPLQPAVQIHQLMLPGKILAVLPPVIQRAQHRPRRAAEEPAQNAPPGEHLLHRLIRLFPGLLRKFHLFPGRGDPFHLQGAIRQDDRLPVLGADLPHQEPRPQILSADRIQPL